MIKSVAELNYVPEMPEKPRNIVIVGAGGIVSGVQLPAYEVAKFPVVGIYDIDYEKAQKVGKDFNIPHVCKELSELIALAQKEDAVFDIAVPASALPEILKQLPEKSGVLMQKPMGESIAQAKEILNICKTKNFVAGVNFQLRQAPYMIAARKLIEDGVIGDIVDIDWRVVELHPWHLWDFLFEKERMEINYHSIHYVDLIRSLVGNPTSVYCKTLQHPKMRALKQTRSAMILDYGQDLRVNLHINHNHDFAPDYQESTCKIEGMKGAIRITVGLILDYPTGRPDKVEYIVDDGKGWRELEVKGSWFNEAFIGTMGGLMKKMDDPSYVFMNDYEDAYQTMCVIEALYESSDNGGTIVKY
ncbi:MAG: Gfo/Idh/MocA family protein [Breznakia sp.]